jgi:hypothetical protein
MGTISRITSAEEGITYFRVLEEVDAEQVLSQIISFLTGSPTRLVIWDIGGGTLRKLSASDLKMIIARAKPYTGSRAGGRTAIVCTNEVDFGLSRMFEAFAESYEIPFEIRVFRDREKARAWLDELPKSMDQDDRA